MSWYCPPICASSGFGIQVGQYTGALILSARRCHPFAHAPGQLAFGAAVEACTPTPSAKATRAATAVALMAEQPSALHQRRWPVHERRHLGPVDDDCVAAGALELLHLVAVRQLEVGDRELAGGNSREQVEHDVDRGLVVHSLERALELFLVANLDRAVQAEIDRLGMELLQPAVVVLEGVEDEEIRIRRGRSSLERHVRSPEDRQRGRLPHAGGITPHDERLGVLLLRRPGGIGVLDGGDHGDPVPLGDRMTEAALGHPGAGSVSGAHWPIGCHTVFSSRKLAISHGLWTSGRPCTTRFTFSAASVSRSADPPFALPRSSAFTSMCAARIGASSERNPVRRLTTPPGRSLVAIASASSMAAS